MGVGCLCLGLSVDTDGCWMISSTYVVVVTRGTGRFDGCEELPWLGVLRDGCLEVVGSRGSLCLEGLFDGGF